MPTEVFSPETSPQVFSFVGLPTGGQFVPIDQGFSSTRVWRYTTSIGDWAIRWTPQTTSDRERMAWIAIYLSKLRINGAAYLPTPLHLKTGESFVENRSGLLQVETWMSGDRLTPTSTENQKQTAIYSLADFHKLSGRLAQRSVAPLEITSAFQKRIQLLEQIELNERPSSPAWDELQGLIKDGVGPARRKLEEVRDCETTILPVHGDSRAEHFLFTGDQLTGLIDFGAMRFDTPWVDLARLCGDLSTGDQNEFCRLIAIYADQIDSNVDVNAVTALHLSGIVIACARWLSWLDRPLSERGEHRLKDLKSRLKRLLSQL